MEIPPNISSSIYRINQSEDRWKALYVATWGYSYQISTQFFGTPLWDKEISFGLPASKNNCSHPYTPNQLYSILTSRDGEFTIGHIQTLFSIFEDIWNESSKILCSKELDTSKWENIAKFFDENKDIISNAELRELKLAKETRNCYLHKLSKIDQRWVEAYIDAKGINPISSIGGELSASFPNSFHQIEEWNELITNLTNKIKIKIEVI